MFPLSTATSSPVILTTSLYLYVESVSHDASLIVIIVIPNHLERDNKNELTIIYSSDHYYIHHYYDYTAAQLGFKLRFAH